MGNDEILKRTEEGMRESHKVLIRELVQDLEEKGIAPAWAIDGEMKKLKLICSSELQDFEKELKKFGLEPSDFCLLTEEENTANRDLIVVHKKSAKVKNYQAGQSSHWLVDFHHDLESNFFTE